MSMTQTQLLAHMEATFVACLEIARKKNTDYAGESGESPFANFEVSLVIGVPVERGFLVRIMDKIKRISNLLSQEALVKDESIIDTLDDVINYLALLKAYLVSTGKLPALLQVYTELKLDRLEVDLDSQTALVPTIITPPASAESVVTEDGNG